MLHKELQKIVDEENSLVRWEQSAASKSPTPPSPKCARKDTLLTMYSEIIENLGASTSVSVDGLSAF